MGGMGALRIAFKNPELFAVVAALEPGIEPALSFEEIMLRDRFWRSDAVFEERYGRPVDRQFWQANNPANVAENNASARAGRILWRSGQGWDGLWQQHADDG
jgi:S-formylglutathione hydrolase